MTAMRLIVSLCVLALAGSGLAEPVVAAERSDPRVQITSPRAGQVFASGATVVVTVSSQVPVQAGWVAVGLQGAGVLQGTNYNGTTFQASFKIPEDAAGPVGIIPAVIGTDGTAIEGVGLTIIVRPSGAPESLSLVEATFMVNAPGETENIYVRGEYPGGVERDLSTASTGTAYRSSDGHIAKVDINGHVLATGYGIAIVSVTNGGRKAFASVWVEDSQHPLPPTDVTPQVKVERLTPQITPFDASSSSYTQTVRVTNVSPIPLPGQLYVVLSDLPAKSVITNSGRTKIIEPVNSPYYSMRLPNGLTLLPGQSTSAKITVYITGSQPIDYTVRVFRRSLEQL